MKSSPIRRALEATAVESGWRIAARRLEVGQVSLELECWECLARIVRSQTHVIHGRLRPCHHPAADDATPFLEDVPCRLLVRRFGPMSLDEVGQALGVTRERARQIEFAALRKLRRACLAEGMTLEEAQDLIAHIQSRATQTATDLAVGVI